MLYKLITNWVLIIPLCSWLASELIKILVALARGKGLNLSYFIGSGGMPSAHAAMVSSLATSAAIMNGFGSPLFGIAVIMALIVMYDASAVQQSVRHQSAILNRIILELKRREPLVKITLLQFVPNSGRYYVLVGANPYMNNAIYCFVCVAGVKLNTY